MLKSGHLLHESLLSGLVLPEFEGEGLNLSQDFVALRLELLSGLHQRFPHASSRPFGELYLKLALLVLAFELRLDDAGGLALLALLAGQPECLRAVLFEALLLHELSPQLRLLLPY